MMTASEFALEAVRAWTLYGPRIVTHFFHLVAILARGDEPIVMARAKPLDADAILDRVEAELLAPHIDTIPAPPPTSDT